MIVFPLFWPHRTIISLDKDFLVYLFWIIIRKNLTCLCFVSGLHDEHLLSEMLSGREVPNKGIIWSLKFEEEEGITKGSVKGD
jgi:hypothetical protein